MARHRKSTDPSVLRSGTAASLLYALRPELRRAYCAAVLDCKGSFTSSGGYVSIQVRYIPYITACVLRETLGGRVSPLVSERQRRDSGFMWSIRAADAYEALGPCIPYMHARDGEFLAVLAEVRRRHAMRRLTERSDDDD